MQASKIMVVAVLWPQKPRKFMREDRAFVIVAPIMTSYLHHGTFYQFRE
jgi:hypothetical protein